MSLFNQLYGFYYLYAGCVEQCIVCLTREEAEQLAIKEANGHSFLDENDKEIKFETYSDVEDFMLNKNMTEHEIFVQKVTFSKELSKVLLRGSQKICDCNDWDYEFHYVNDIEETENGLSELLRVFEK